MPKFDITPQQLATIRTLLAQGAQNLLNDALRVFDNPLPEEEKKEKKDAK